MGLLLPIWMRSRGAAEGKAPTLMSLGNEPVSRGMRE